MYVNYLLGKGVYKIINIYKNIQIINMSEKEKKVLHFKVILLGSTAVGKSSLLNRYTRQSFS